LKIYLDDERDAPDGDGWIRFYTAGEVISYLQSKVHWDSVEVISLDYYLGGREFGTGYDVMKYIEELVFCDIVTEIPIILFHTSSPDGQRLMEMSLNSMWRYLSK